MDLWTSSIILYFFYSPNLQDKFKYVKAYRIYFSPYNLLSIKEENTKEKR